MRPCDVIMNYGQGTEKSESEASGEELEEFK